MFIIIIIHIYIYNNTNTDHRSSCVIGGLIYIDLIPSYPCIA